MSYRSWSQYRTCLAVALTALTILAAPSANAAAPAIRISTKNQVPACVTPARLMAFLESRNKQLSRRFHQIAEWYKYHGESWQVRWDYAFYQMAIETNFLSYRRPNGKWGDVDPRQNNFAGIGTTGGGVPGNNFPNVSTGVLAQIQHLVVYSGERIANPVAQRTKLTQNIILKGSARVARRRPVTFQDLSGRWAVDRNYGRTIQRIASVFHKKFCGPPKLRQVRATPQTFPQAFQTSVTPQLARKPTQAKNPAQALVQPRIRPPKRQLAVRANPPVRARRCSVDVASYGGNHTVLIRSRNDAHLKLTALDVDRRYESELAHEFIASYAQGGSKIASYKSRAEALVRAHAMCDEINRRS